MVVGDVALSVCVNRVIRRVGVQAHVFIEFTMSSRFGAQIRLSQRIDGLLHQFNAHPLVAFAADDRAVMAVVNLERTLGEHVA